MEGLVRKITQVLSRPSAFFSARMQEPHIRESALYLITLTFVSSILSSMLQMLLQGTQLSLMRKFFYLNLPLPGAGPVKLAMLTVAYSLILIILSYLVAFLLRVWMRLFMVHTSFTQSYQLLSYAATPIYLFGWMSESVSFVTWVWALMLLVIGSKCMFTLSKRKAWLMFILPAIIFVVGRIAAGAWIARLVGGF